MFVFGSVGGAVFNLRVTTLDHKSLVASASDLPLLLTSESGQGHPWRESHQFLLLLCDVFAEPRCVCGSHLILSLYQPVPRSGLQVTIDHMEMSLS